jgi:hypothetical protein
MRPVAGLRVDPAILVVTIVAGWKKCYLTGLEDPFNDCLSNDFSAFDRNRSRKSVSGKPAASFPAGVVARIVALQV